jgi:hypothetical protein
LLLFIIIILYNEFEPKEINMKKTNLFITSVAVAAALCVGSANAAPNRGGGNHAPRQFVTHTHGAPRSGGHHHVTHHHNPAPTPVVVSHHHHHHHGARTGDFIIATAILLSALI